MSKKYIPQIGDVVLDNNIPMVVVTMKSYEDVGSCGYDRKYFLCEEEYFHKLSGCMTTIEAMDGHGRWVQVRGTEFPNIKQVMDIAPYEIIPIQGFHVRQKEAKTVTIYE